MILRKKIFYFRQKNFGLRKFFEKNSLSPKFFFHKKKKIFGLKHVLGPLDAKKNWSKSRGGVCKSFIGTEPSPGGVSQYAKMKTLITLEPKLGSTSDKVLHLFQGPLISNLGWSQIRGGGGLIVLFWERTEYPKGPIIPLCGNYLISPTGSEVFRSQTWFFKAM